MKDLTCPICGRTEMSDLRVHVTKTHKMTKEEFIEKYPDQKMVSDELHERMIRNLDKGREICWSDPDHIEKMKESGRRSMYENINSSPKKREWASQAAKKYHEDNRGTEEYHKAATERMVKTHSSHPELAQATSDRLREWWRDPEYRYNQTERFRSQVNDYWKDPEIIKKMGYGRGKAVYLERLDGSKIRMRSSWEVRVGQLLSQYNVRFEYERLVIPYEYEGKRRKYITDFYLPEYNLIIEVKPYMFISQGKNLDKELACKDLGYRYLYVTENQVRLSDVELLNYLSVESSTTIEK